MLRSVLPAILLFLPTLAYAEPVQAHYAAYAAGLNVLVMDATLDVSPQRYRLEIGFKTAGTFALFIHSQIQSRVEGNFASSVAAPSRFASAGVLRGEQRLTQIDYQSGQPVISKLMPPSEKEREPVPPEQQRGTVDTMSAMAQLIRQVNETGRCDGSVRTFDGRRLATLRAWTIGNEDLPPTKLSSYAGRALHCGFEGKQLGGFAFDEDRERLQRPQLGGAWFAAVSPGQPMIPVRISFHTRWFGDATMFITPKD